MNFGDRSMRALRMLTTLCAAMLAALAPQVALSQDAVTVTDAPGTVAPAQAAEADVVVTEAAGPDAAYEPLGPEWIKGQPTSFEDDAAGSMTFQDQFSSNGDYALWMHDAILLPVITIISLFVLGLLLWVIARYRRRANPVPSKTTHNTLVEVVWTLVPVLILVGIAIPSITLLARQYETPPEEAVTIKAIGYQWYWGYEYPDNGGFEVVSNMLSNSEAIANGEPALLAVDNRMVVPANTPLRIQTTGADVIHAFSVPSLWFKIDAVPGRLNERMLTIDEPGIYYGQCSELCGVKHGFMPIAVEALPRDKWEAWVRSQGGTVAGDEPAVAEQADTAAPAADAAADTESEVAGEEAAPAV
ncbi:cytochrome c oxidase subunit II [Pontixanthobacter sp.]|uniref:cytochrome c oxidase subunit II n=1 Tax=Pontixanthobacter sp. TaxID=2792078 RepID=UPI003C79D3B2